VSDGGPSAVCRIFVSITNIDKGYNDDNNSCSINNKKTFVDQVQAFVSVLFIFVININIIDVYISVLETAAAAAGATTRRRQR
jgi:hypothetical protein